MARSMPHRTNDPKGLRQKVLNAAASLFQSQGYNATSMRDLQQAAEVSAGAMYHHFPTKKACGLGVIRECVGPAVYATWLRPLAEAPCAKSGIEHVLTAIVDELEQAQRVRGCPLNNLTLELALVDPEYRVEIAKIFAMWERTIAEKLQSDIEGRRLKSMDVEAFATFVVATCSGAMALAKAEQNVRALKTCRGELSAALGKFERKLKRHKRAAGPAVARTRLKSRPIGSIATAI
jgi:TetR/AcrR family transcriptional repressor of nem operon